ncbi:MAG: hypothetical protein WBX35_22925, partial [Pseudolabrys sp.]
EFLPGMLSRVCPMLSSQDRPQSRAEMNATTPSLGPSSRSMLAGQSSQPWEIVEWPEKTANCLSAKKKRKNRGSVEAENQSTKDT